MKARGKAEPGMKTLLDVLVPLLAALRGGADTERLRAVATEAAQATVPMKAIRGRASFLGERSIGHMDPGARSACLMAHASRPGARSSSPTLPRCAEFWSRHEHNQ